jgi:tetratricopeptide (TPR) repeat protein
MLRTEMGDEMERRLLLAQSGLTLVGLANPWLLDPVDRVVDSIDGRRIGHGTVADIESITAARRRMDDALGGGSLLSAVREDLRISINLLTRASYSAEVGRRLYSATAEQARLASWLCFDTGRHGLAQRYTQMALRAAHSAEDRQVGANVLGFAAYQAGIRGDGVAAEAFSRTALAGGRGTLTPAVEGAVHARLGMGRARLGDLPRAAASFETAEGLLTSSDLEEEPDWIYWFTVGDLYGIIGQSYMFANEPGTAIEHLNHAIDGTSEEFTRDRALWLGTTATAQVLNGDLEESRHTAESALEILGGDFGSGRVIEVLTEFCGVLRTHNTRDAADFEERLAAYTHMYSQV